MTGLDGREIVPVPLQAVMLHPRTLSQESLQDGAACWRANQLITKAARRFSLDRQVISGFPIRLASPSYLLSTAQVREEHHLADRLWRSVSSIARRSTPMPKPPQGGMP